MRFLILTILLVSCTHSAPQPSSLSLLHPLGHKPFITVISMEDATKEKKSPHTASTLTQLIVDRLIRKNQVSLHPQSKEFAISMQLLQNEETFPSPQELTLSVLLKIVDLRGEKPQVVFQEVITHNALLEGSLPKEETFNWEDLNFRVGPLGLAYAKISREISTRIEEFTKLAAKGN